MKLFKKITTIALALTMAIGLCITTTSAKATYLEGWQKYVTLSIAGEDYILADMLEEGKVDLNDVDKETPVFVKIDEKGMQEEYKTDKVVNFKSYISWYTNGSNPQKHTIQPKNEDGTYSFLDAEGNNLTVGQLGRVMTFGIYLDKAWETKSNFAYVGMDSVKAGYFRVFGENDYYTNEFTIIYIDAETGEELWESGFVDYEKGLFGVAKKYEYAELPLLAGFEYVPGSTTAANKCFGYTDQTLKISVKVLDTDYTELDKAIEEAEKVLADTKGKEDCYDKGLLEEVKNAAEVAKSFRKGDGDTYQFIVNDVANTLKQYVAELKASYKAPEKPAEGDKAPETSDMSNVAGYTVMMLAAAGYVLVRKREEL